jgi:pSer/pThr/pTyr-binding forkhead associated (FHA) protein
MPAQLLPLTDGPSILLDKPILLIGRHPECDIQIDSRKVSRRHCCIAQVGDCLVVRDLGSTNGIRVNGVRVVEGRVRAGDELTIGNSRFKVRWDALGASVGGGARPAAAKEPRSAAALEVPDDLLENYDDPVALEEPKDSPMPQPLGRKPNPQPVNPPSDAQSSRPILPDELELAPASDIFPSGPAPSHHSHHPQ